MQNNSDWTTIEEVRGTIENTYEGCQLRTKIELKSWAHHSENCHANGEYPLPFLNYVAGMRDVDYLEQVKGNVLDCEDLGGKEDVIKYLMKRMNR
ncbi:hypothetical protein HXA31_15475 [Salipaludibacillus agaradhaerens]|uniref:Uncharacterized protein n=1 Tax=Salipaludibacillus agaradhaerens TaxID=76935 RepID=A0A9Q4G1B8_SALAG|nr:hypothetical protein [Salipaludibacillus agaradhaerens]MCR6098763.1 hypothetical protein [Salipaludibacillus agaradhaerens]MCR6115770.1 hypothetical protein [Salipaludibacillus agaradhaerens]